MTAPLPSMARAVLQTVRSHLTVEDEAYLVGGFLRDLLLGRPSRDLDLVVSQGSLDMARRIADTFQGTYYPLDRERGVGRAQFVAEGDQWTVDVSTLHGTLDEDLAQRDFTVDALALPVDSETLEEIHDPLGGQEDMERRTIQAISEQGLIDDPARLLRGVRLAGEMGFQMAPKTEEWVKAHAAKVTTISAERARDEFARVLGLPYSLFSLRKLDELDLLCALVPELEAGKGLAQPREHHWDVFDHNMETVGYAERMLLASERLSDPVLQEVPWREGFDEHFQEVMSVGRARVVSFKLAALLHDVAKPQTKTVEPSGRTRFFGHGEQGAQAAAGIMDRLRFSRRETRAVSTMVAQHLRPVQLSQRWEPPTRKAVYRFYRDLDDVAIDTLYLSLADHLAAIGPRLELEEWRKHTALIEQVLALGEEKEGVAAPPKLVDGRCLMRALGLPPGPEVGWLLEAIKEAQAAGEVRTRQEALALATRYYEEG